MNINTSQSLADLWAPLASECAWDERAELAQMGVDVLVVDSLMAARADSDLMTRLAGRRMRQELARPTRDRFVAAGLASRLRMAELREAAAQ
ncbi:MAG: hypothetical protein JWM95_1047 [Gemmatimonadetes bacterium]|nr:hypothetical protein [Gemmatimonadota bacterium]